MTEKRLRSTKDLTTLDEVLEKEGTREAFQAVAMRPFKPLPSRRFSPSRSAKR
jgi:hypothetical protein